MSETWIKDTVLWRCPILVKCTEIKDQNKERVSRNNCIFGFFCGGKKRRGPRCNLKIKISFQDFKFYSNFTPFFVARERNYTTKGKQMIIFAERCETTAGLPVPLHLHHITFIVMEHLPGECSDKAFICLLYRMLKNMDGFLSTGMMPHTLWKSATHCSLP